MKQVLIADDHFGLCQAMKLLFEKRITGCSVAISHTLDETIDILHEDEPDVLVIDADLPGLEIEEKIGLLRQHFPHGLIVFSSTKPETSAMVMGEEDVLFFDKSSPSEFLLQLLQKE
jgi:DNA-binding NarL/FixJ family response regulator